MTSMPNFDTEDELLKLLFDDNNDNKDVSKEKSENTNNKRKYSYDKNNVSRET